MKNNRKKIVIIIGISILLASGIALKFYVDTAINYKSTLKPENKVGETAGDRDVQDFKQSVDSKSTINVLLLGIDKSDNRDLGVYRSDTIAVARMNLDKNEIRVLNIPRDTYTFVPIEGKLDKINHAYAFGSISGNGVQASIDAVNEFLGHKAIDYYFVMDMDPIPQIVDEIGDLEIYVDTKMVDKDEDVTLEKGVQVINGKQAVTYLQWRYSPGGETDRIERQRNFVSAFIKQQRNNGEIMQTMQIVLKYMDKIQTNFSAQQMVALAAYINQLPDGKITYSSLSGNGKMINNISYWVPNNKEQIVKEFFRQ